MDETPPSKRVAATEAAKRAREEQLARALRENLRKRKQQARARGENKTDRPER